MTTPKQPPRRAPRRVAAKPAPAPVSPLAPVFEPIIISDEEPDEEVEMVDLFEVRGQMYQVPAKPPFTHALKAISTARTQGAGMAELMILEEVVGPEAWAALCSAKGVTGTQVAKIANAVSLLVMGALEDEASGNS